MTKKKKNLIELKYVSQKICSLLENPIKKRYE